MRERDEEEVKHCLFNLNTLKPLVSWLIFFFSFCIFGVILFSLRGWWWWSSSSKSTLYKLGLENRRIFHLFFLHYFNLPFRSELNDSQQLFSLDCFSRKIDWKDDDDNNNGVMLINAMSTIDLGHQKQTHTHILTHTLAHQ